MKNPLDFTYIFENRYTGLDTFINITYQKSNSITTIYY